MTDVLEEYGVQWVVTAGTEDDQADLSRDEIRALDQTHDLSLTQTNSDGVSNTFNYIIQIMDNESTTETAFSLYVLDSGALSCNGVAGFGCIEDDQVAWLASNAPGDSYGLVFCHMPTPEFLDAFNDLDYYGVKNGLVSCQAENTGLVQLMQDKNFAQGISVGHDTRNSFYAY